MNDPNKTTGSPGGTPSGDSSDLAMPTQIGRYRIDQVLGEGGFGLVFLAFDEQLQRQVAIKVRHPELAADSKTIEAYLIEARTVAGLDHPHIVPVYDVGSTSDFPCYVVSKYIDGTDLSKRLKKSRLSIRDSIDLVATIAEALHYAHKRGLVHRDVKPGNVLLERGGKPYLADFGIALSEREVGRGPRYVGSPPYMSPEQARGEGHRVDGRSDIFSLGSVLYELLTGRQPFKGDTQQELLDQVTGFEPRPPRQWDDGITKELERICLKALSKRASERYTTARDFADDLRQYLAEQPSSQSVTPHPSGIVPVLPSGSTAAQSGAETGEKSDSQLIKIVPKGLRSFDAHDADFFLELMPGPRDREGLPDSIRFWKTRIEEPDADNTFSVGLIYGPSGCGKSSLMKAGLLPRLSPHVTAIYVEARATDTESRLLAALRKHCPMLSPEISLKDALRALRRDEVKLPADKLVIILDQFEQWLHAQKGESSGELTEALRQCDGGRVQCIIMVRDDFWMGITRFLTTLEIELQQGHNFAAADLFDLDHAQRVLAALGRAFGKLPTGSGEMTKPQKEFLKQVVTGLAQDGKIVCIRLALFAEMMKGKPWTPATLKEIGGTEGVGVTFLEETFSSSMANPSHRMYLQEAQAVLSALLPERGTDIKGHMRSHTALRKAAGMEDRPQHFEALLRILDSELRLITPTDWEGKSGDDNASNFDEAEKYYQLTHDYLVPSLRDWLTRKQKETPSGRAELLLADRAAVWTARPETRQLPSLRQWFQIKWLTHSQNWTQQQRKMMDTAARHHLVRGSILTALVVVACWLGYQTYASVQARALRDRLLSATTPEVPDVVNDMRPYRRWAIPLLRDSLQEAERHSDPRKQLHASLALLPTDPRQVDYLYDRLLTAAPHEVSTIVNALAPSRELLVNKLWTVMERPKPKSQRLRAAAALAIYDPQNTQWKKFNSLVVDDLVQENSVFLGQWSQALRPIKNQLLDPLTQVYVDRHAERGGERTLATNLLADYAEDQPEKLAQLVVEADEKQFAVIDPKFEPQFDRGLPVIVARLSFIQPDNSPVEVRSRSARKQANAAIILLKHRQPDHVWKLLQRTSDPTARSYVVHRLHALGAKPESLLDRLETEPDVSARRALHLALGEYNWEEMPTGRRDALLAKLRDQYLANADPGLHASTEWLLRQWSQEPWLTKTNEDWRNDADGRQKKWNEVKQALTSENCPPQWYVDGQGNTLVVIKGPVSFQMGSPRSEVGRQDDIYHQDIEHQHEHRIGRTFALANKSIAIEQYWRFKKDDELGTKYTRMAELPVIRVSWIEAAAYCNWLSEQEGIPKEEWCYTTIDRMTVPKPNCLQLTGYRLPTEAEFEYATRAGAVTSRYFGEAEDLLPKYVWYQKNSSDQTWPVGRLKPNDLGLFDMHGNVFTWCEERTVLDPSKKVEDAPDGPEDLIKGDKPSRVLRGGAFFNQPSIVRSAYRYFIAPGIEINYAGLRVARTIIPSSVPSK